MVTLSLVLWLVVAPGCGPYNTSPLQHLLKHIRDYLHFLQGIIEVKKGVYTPEALRRWLNSSAQCYGLITALQDSKHTIEHRKLTAVSLARSGFVYRLEAEASKLQAPWASVVLLCFVSNSRKLWVFIGRYCSALDVAFASVMHV